MLNERIKNISNVDVVILGQVICPNEEIEIEDTGWFKNIEVIEAMNNNILKRKDYKTVRYEFMVHVATVGFSNLSAEEKIKASSNFIVSKADRDTVHSLVQQIQNGRLFHARSTESRKARKLAAEVEIYNRISDPSEIADLLSIASSLMYSYVEFGIEGTLEGDHVGLFDFLESRSGTDFENTGLLSKTYTINGMTIAELSTKLMDILKNGNY